jgi:anti-sigma factor RsiW
MFFWTKNRGRKLSAYFDGELPPAQQMHMGEKLAFDADLRAELSELEQLQTLVDAALSPVPAAAPTTFIDHLPAAVRSATPTPQTRRHLTPAAIAAAGIIVTAGITFARLRRRGIV